eukprot:COSAG01_NODE_1259_length_11009_cov_53.138930_1_plen_90_part_00
MLDVFIYSFPYGCKSKNRLFDRRICDLCIWNQFLNVNILEHSHFFEDKRNLPTLKHLEEILSMYSGSIENGQMHGHGKLQYANGDVFEV